MPMTEKRDTFDELVKSLAISERREMLERLAEVTEAGVGASEMDSEAASPERTLAGADEKKSSLLDEGFLVRLWFKILAFFSSSTPEEKYNAHLVADLGKKLSQKYGVYFSLNRRMYTDSLYQDFSFLENIRSFFLPYANEYDKHRGDFYILLASLVAPESAAAISSTLDPFSESYETDEKKDIHSSFLKKMDGVLDSFSADEKNKLYQAAQAAEWFSAFASFSLNRIILQFSDTTGRGQMCPIDTVTEDFKKLCSILTSAVKVPISLIETFFIFLEKDKIQDESFSFDQECTGFVKTAANNLSGITSFRNRIPLADFVRFSIGDISWDPDIERRGEDWFKLFKIAWKERFEKRFAEWIILRDKYALKKRTLAFLECREFPELEYSPWEYSWLELKFHREPVFLFLKAFFSGVYPRQISRVLKIIHAEGDFYKRENLIEFTDDFNILEHDKQDIADFEMRLSPKGDLGEDFALALTEKKGTHSGKTRLEHLMITVETEADSLCTRTLSALQSMDDILGGILNASRGGSYDTLSNLSAIQGVNSESFRADLSSARSKIQECINIMAELSK